MVWKILCLVISLVCLSVDSAVVFPTSKLPVQLESPSACPNGHKFCGGDDSKYPMEKIKQIIGLAVKNELTPENIQHYFRQKESSDEEDLEGLEPACSSRREMIPPRARAQNIFKDWVYLLELADKQTQQVEVTICDNPEESCKNDKDKPDENEIVCKQVFRSQKLLAVNKDGEIVVDTFELPSACVCSYKKKLPLAFRGFPFGPPNISSFDYDDNHELAIAEKEAKDAHKKVQDALRSFRNLLCPEGHNAVSEKLFTPSVHGWSKTKRDASAVIFETPPEADSHGHGQRVEKVVAGFAHSAGDGACTRFNSTTNICEEHTGYPAADIKRFLSNSNSSFRSPAHFKKLFDMPCEPEKDLTALRFGYSPDEQPLCDSYHSYHFPKIGRTVDGTWRYIINIEEYKQGVSMDVCNRRVKDKGCKYGGKNGLNPDETVCKQLYSHHNMLTISGDKGIAYETFLFPSACVCHLKNTYYAAVN